MVNELKLFRGEVKICKTNLEGVFFGLEGKRDLFFIKQLILRDGDYIIGEAFKHKEDMYEFDSLGVYSDRDFKNKKSYYNKKEYERGE